MIAGQPDRAYLAVMVARRLLPFLAMLAIVLAPLSMVGGPAAMAQSAMPAPSSHHEQSAGAPSHCTDMAGEDQQEDDSSRQGDCLSDCAVTCSAIPALGNLFADSAMLPALAHPQPLVDRMQGLNPESIDPPPRTA
jgi:hypothetical protein